MQRATLEELASAPVGRYVAGETFAHGCITPELWLLVLWGQPHAEQAFALGRSLVLELAPPAVPHASLVDATRLAAGDAGAFSALEKYLVRFGDALKNWVTRLALVRPPGLGGAIVSGAYQVLPRPYPVAVFDDVAGAFTWLDPSGISASDAAAALAAMHDESTGAPPVVAALRNLLDRHLAGIAVGEVASALGMSERSLQRRLGESNTTFQDEMADARVRAAKRMLLDTDAPLTAIALDVGCASLQHFSALFRKRTNLSPSAFRRRNRA